MKSFEMPEERILLFEIYRGSILGNILYVDNIIDNNMNSMIDKSKNVKNMGKKKVLVRNNRKFN